jgi:hypothetical protein
MVLANMRDTALAGPVCGVSVNLARAVAVVGDGLPGYRVEDPHPCVDAVGLHP